MDSKQFFRLAENHYSLLGHEMRLSKERWRLDIRKYFFLSQTLISSWNSLPANVVNAKSVNSFKNAYLWPQFSQCLDTYKLMSVPVHPPKSKVTKTTIITSGQNFVERPHRRLVTPRSGEWMRLTLAPSYTCFLRPTWISPPERHLDRFSRFRRAHPCVQHTWSAPSKTTDCVQHTHTHAHTHRYAMMAITRAELAPRG